MHKRIFIVLTSIILTVVMTLPVVFSMTQHQVLTCVELESKKPSEISDVFDFLEGIIEYDSLSVILSHSFKILDYHQVSASDEYKAIFSPPPDLYI